MEVIVILITTFIAAILSSMSGGGTSIISIPVFLSFGISLPITLSIQRINSACWTLPAARNYLKGRRIDWLFLFLFSIIGLIGAYFGVLVVISINQIYLEKIIGSIIVFLVIYLYFQKDLGLKENISKYSAKRKLLSYPFALILGFYESILGTGNAILFTIVAFVTRGFDFIDAMGHYYVIAFIWVSFAAILFIQKGYFNLYLTVPAIIGSTLGGYIGSKYARNRGNKFIKFFFIIVGGLLGVKLIIGI
jgi:uncharacterized membrane protein YfcA